MFEPADKKLGSASGIIMEKNLILYGPPGTGKTYETIKSALEILQPDNVPLSRKEQKKAFDEWKEKGHIGFVTFHQSFSYEDFVEGIRAVTDIKNNNSISYQIESGIFKLFCKDSTIRLSHDKIFVPNKTKVWKLNLGKSWDDTSYVFDICKERNFICLPIGDGKDFTNCKNEQEIFENLNGNNITSNMAMAKTIAQYIFSMKIGDLVIIPEGVNKIKAIGIVTGNYEYKIFDFHYEHTRKVQWINIYPSAVSNNFFFENGKNFSDKLFYEVFLSKTESTSFHNNLNTPSSFINSPPRVLIIDEINRGNIAGIFGELITLIEPSKRIGEEEELKVRLPYSREEFGVPSNLYIIGTMNTADRSLTGLDIALRRRFHFRYMPPRPDLLEGKMLANSGVSVGRVLAIMNQRIEALLDKDHCIGHAPFMHLPDGEVPVEELAAVFKGTIIPLLEEYFFEDWEKIRLVLNDHRKDVRFRFILRQVVDAELFGPESDVSTKTLWQQNQSAFASLESFVGIVDASIRLFPSAKDVKATAESAPDISNQRHTPPDTIAGIRSINPLRLDEKIYNNKFRLIRYRRADANNDNYGVYDMDGNKIEMKLTDFCDDLIRSDERFKGCRRAIPYNTLNEIMNRITD